MHSIIIELSDEKVSKDDEIKEIDFYEELPYPVDYVYDLKDKEGEIDRFVYALEWSSYPIEYNKDDSTIIFKEHFQETYFTLDYERFKELVLNLDLTEFSTDSLLMYKISKVANDQFSFKIYYEGVTYSMDDFVRSILDLNKTYHFGGVVGYHA